MPNSVVALQNSEVGERDKLVKFVSAISLLPSVISIIPSKKGKMEFETVFLGAFSSLRGFRGENTTRNYHLADYLDSPTISQSIR